MKFLYNRRLGALILLLALLLAAAIGWFSRPPLRSGEFYIADYAELLSDASEQAVVAANTGFIEQCGARLFIAAVESTGLLSPDSMAAKTARSWQLGESDMLLLLCSSGGRYGFFYGQKLEPYFEGEKLTKLMAVYLEPYTAVYDFNGAVISFIGACHDEFSHTSSLDNAEGALGNIFHFFLGNGKSEQSIIKTNIFKVLMIVLVIIITIARYRKRQKRSEYHPQNVRPDVELYNGQNRQSRKK